MQRSANKLDYKQIYNIISTQWPNHGKFKMSNSVPIKEWRSHQTSQIHDVQQCFNTVFTSLPKRHASAQVLHHSLTDRRPTQQYASLVTDCHKALYQMIAQACRVNCVLLLQSFSLRVLGVGHKKNMHFNNVIPSRQATHKR